MHKLAKQYRPKSGSLRKPWQEDAGFLLILHNISANDEVAYRRFFETKKWIPSLDKSPDAYGLTHGDLHQGNFFVHEGEITAFDFDDSAYHFFVYDFSAILCGLIGSHERQAAAIDIPACLESLMHGYERENNLPHIWQERIPLFIEWRWIVVYHWIAARLKTEHFGTEQKNSFLEFQRQCRSHISEQMTFR